MKPSSALLFLVVASLAWLHACPLHAEYVTINGTRVTEGQMHISPADLERLEERAIEEGSGDSRRVAPPLTLFILEATRADVEISGVFARVRLEQDFRNPYAERVEARYVFPLPENAAVDRFSFTIAETVIEGVVKERDEARHEYERARDEGRKGALLEEERANIFSQSVANIPPGETVTVRIAYVHPVKIDGGDYTFRFPMVVAPRYIPGQPLARPNVGRGWSGDTDQVPDASRITPPTLPPGMRHGNDVFITVHIDAAMPIRKITPVTHELEILQPGPTEARITLKNGSTIANQDFVVEYGLAGEQPVLASLAHREDGSPEGYVALVLQPKRDIHPGEITPREVVLVLDKSGSMSGESIRQLRIFAGHLLEKLDPRDTFRIVAFDSGVHVFSDDPLPASPENIAAGRRYVRELTAGSGTEMLPALKSALGTRGGEEGRPRYLMLLTDALVGNDDAILGYLRHDAFADVRAFPVAIGSAPNHYLTERAAEIGRGFATHVTHDDNAVEMARRFVEKTSTPYLTDLELDWGEIGVRDVVPGVLLDLHAGEPLVILARYSKPGRSEVRLRANLRGQEIATTMSVELPSSDPAHDSLPSIWARKRIREIWNRNVGKETAASRAEITRLGLTHGLVTRYTSFVAVEKEVTTKPSGPLITRDVPALLPDGMSPRGASQTAGSAPRTGTPATASPSQPPAPVRTAAAPAPRPVPVDPHPRNGDRGPRRRSGGGSGGSVEWVFLLALLSLVSGSWIARRRQLANGT